MRHPLSSSCSRPRRRARVAAAAATAAAVTGLLATVPAAASPPQRQAPGPAAVVSVGDSYISGEAGRWAGNSDANPANFPRIDALGPTAYYDNAGRTAERVPKCHRSRSAEIHLGLPGTESENLACSGARTDSFRAPKGVAKPGLDFSDAAGVPGQARQLEEYAREHPVRLVAVSIGGNDFRFGDVVTSCVLAYLNPLPKACSQDPANRARFTDQAVERRADDIAGGLRNVRQAMLRAGHDTDDYDVIVQNYPAPIPHGRGFRYPAPLGARQTLGGCAFNDRDADWAVDSVLPAVGRAVQRGITKSGLGNVRFLDLTHSFDGHRLCERGVGLVDPVRGTVSRWTDPGAADKTEWISWVRTVTAVLPPFQVQEALHPNHWGQLALRNCLRQAYASLDQTRKNRLACTGGGPGLNGRGEPRMRLS
ncbi:hypothetical protein OEIGOIKO_06124 [Streptomyces chrestomyceticus JCM 4735]|uniref:SGNH hydrolase-type esterase domain-containing protein n=1 Tax=Streptomyces chrestomyceticus JCM 4735 TaxID=1306181 RepID=A0A7U9L0N2_9ACTN|nr:hypothetical protein OEIGOIKO_06124 [Streptomyces chrestomyceticus JCM 4735]